MGWFPDTWSLPRFWKLEQRGKSPGPAGPQHIRTGHQRTNPLIAVSEFLRVATWGLFPIWSYYGSFSIKCYHVSMIDHREPPKTYVMCTFTCNFLLGSGSISFIKFSKGSMMQNQLLMKLKDRHSIGKVGDEHSWLTVNWGAWGPRKWRPVTISNNNNFSHLLLHTFYHSLRIH